MVLKPANNRIRHGEWMWAWPSRDYHIHLRMCSQSNFLFWNLTKTMNSKMKQHLDGHSPQKVLRYFSGTPIHASPLQVSSPWRWRQWPQYSDAHRPISMSSCNFNRWFPLTNPFFLHPFARAFWAIRFGGGQAHHIIELLTLLSAQPIHRR